MTRKVAVIDGNSLMHRAFHAVPPTMNAPDGTPTNAVFGFLSMLLKFIDMEHPDVLICAFDAGKPEFRLKVIEQYKANRPPMDPDLRCQFPVIEDMLESLHVPVVKLAGWEGDDVLGTVSALCEEQGDETLLVSGDKDIYQLVTDRTRVVTTKKGMTDVVVYGPDEVFERYGVTPAQFIDFLGLKGDSSDNIPGVPGIGDVSAKNLLQKYGSLEGIYEHLGELKGKQQQNLAENRDLAFASREVATICRDVEVSLDLDALVFPAYTAEDARTAFGKYGMAMHLPHMLALVGEAPVIVRKPSLAYPRRLAVGEVTAALEAACAADELIGVGVAEDDQGSLFGSSVQVGLAFSQGCAVLDGEEALDVLAAALRKGRIACFDGKQLLKSAIPSDSVEPRLISPSEALSARIFDCSLAAYVCDSSAGDYSLEAVTARYAEWTLPEAKDAAARALRAAVAALAFAPAAEKMLAERDATEVFRSIDAPLTPVLVEMERTGVAIDTARLKSMSDLSHTQLEGFRQRIFELAGEEFNVDSPVQVSRILFEKLGLKPKKKTTRGYSTDASVLKELAGEHEVPELILKYREQAKLSNTYLDALPRLIANDGLIHTQFNQTVATTGRLSSSDPNLQNIPVRTDFGRMVREAFVPLAPGHVFLSADYSQIELRLLAHLSVDESLIHAFVTGADFHASTAARVFDVPMEFVTPQMRSRAKAVNFGIVYGQQAFGLAQSLGIPFYEAKGIIDRYFETFPRVRQYLDDVVAQAKDQGFAETMFGRRRYLPDLKSGNPQTRAFGERTAMNHPMQGSAADIIKLAMRKVAEELESAGLDAKMMLQVHDELDFSVAKADAEALGALVKDVMEHVAELKVPLIADVSTGATWAEAH
ncbi:MAG: DNA polymerase I [Eggerthellaceae bacterium]|nr:DNA polymerase I [Eggerthellaceae bacterium]